MVCTTHPTMTLQNEFSNNVRFGVLVSDIYILTTSIASLRFCQVIFNFHPMSSGNEIPGMLQSIKNTINIAGQTTRQMAKDISLYMGVPSLKLTANIALENRPSQKETSIPTIHSQVGAVSLREGVTSCIDKHPRHQG